MQRNISWWLISVAVCCLWTCNPKLLTEVSSALTPLTEQETFIIFEQDTVDLSAEHYVGEFRIKDPGLALGCSFETVKDMAEAEARRLGANCLVITEHLYPDRRSTCHRISGRMYKVADLFRYETIINWRPDRRLMIRDFKGSTTERPFQAVTFSYFTYRYFVHPVKRKASIYITTEFSCRNSYFKQSEQDSMVLAHEQVHFDISELFGRMFTEKVQRELTSVADVQTKIEPMYYALVEELNRQQDAYDTEVYAQPNLQGKWTNWVAAELQAYDSLAHKTVIVQDPKKR